MSDVRSSMNAALNKGLPMSTGIGDSDEAEGYDERHQRKTGRSTARLLDLKAAEEYSGISVWTLRDLIASGDLPAVRPPRLRRVWIDKTDLDSAIAGWKERG